MDKKVEFDDTEIEEYEFHQHESPILISNTVINEIVVSNKFSFGKQEFKRFISFKDNKEIRPLCMFLSEVIIYEIYSDKTKCMSFMIKNRKIFEKYMTLWEKVSNTIKKI